MSTFTPELLQRLRAIVESGTPLARSTVLNLIERATEANQAEALAQRLIPTTERDPSTYQSTEEAYDEGHTDGWNEALTELAKLLGGTP